MCSSLNQSILARGMNWIDWSSLVPWLLLEGRVSQSQPLTTDTETGESNFPGEAWLLYPKGKWMLGRHRHQMATVLSKQLSPTLVCGGKRSVPGVFGLLHTKSEDIAVSPAGTAEKDTICEPPSPRASPDCSTSPEDCEAPAR